MVRYAGAQIIYYIMHKFYAHSIRVKCKKKYMWLLRLFIHYSTLFIVYHMYQCQEKQNLFNYQWKRSIILKILDCKLFGNQILSFLIIQASRRTVHFSALIKNAQNNVSWSKSYISINRTKDHWTRLKIMASFYWRHRKVRLWSFKQHAFFQNQVAILRSFPAKKEA